MQLLGLIILSALAVTGLVSLIWTAFDAMFTGQERHTVLLVPIRGEFDAEFVSVMRLRFGGRAVAVIPDETFGAPPTCDAAVCESELPASVAELLGGRPSIRER